MLTFKDPGYMLVVVFCIVASFSNLLSTTTASVLVFACENQEFELTFCKRVPGNDIVIKVEEATYGRTCCPLKCPHPSGDPTKTANTQCGVKDNILKKMQDLCDGKLTCKFTPTNKFFGSDPCRGTYKMLRLEYDCFSSSRWGYSDSNVSSTMTTPLPN